MPHLPGRQTIPNFHRHIRLSVQQSGYLKPDEAMSILKIGPEYRQVAIKTEKAVKIYISSEQKK